MRYEDGQYFHNMPLATTKVHTGTFLDGWDGEIDDCEQIA